MGILWDSVDSVTSRKLDPARTRPRVLCCLRYSGLHYTYCTLSVRLSVPVSNSVTAVTKRRKTVVQNRVRRKTKIE